MFNAPTEAISLKTLCSSNTKISGLMLASLDDSYYHTPEGKEAYRAILTHIQKKGRPPAFKLLCEDVSLTEETRDFISSADGMAKSTAQVEQLLSSLNQYRQTRLYYSLAKKLLRNLEQPRVDVDELSEIVAGQISKIQLRRSGEAVVINIGRDSNVREMLEELVYGDSTDSCIPTGFHTFDSVNGGFFRGSLVTIGATSGGGKSLLANQLNVNQSSLGYKTTLVPLEMSAQEMLSRIASSESGLPSIDIFLKRLASGEQDALWRKFRRFDKNVASANGRYTIFKPKEDLSIEELMASLHGFHSDVIYIDYISLLKGADGEDQWRKLGQIARFGKVYAENNNKVVVMLAQVNEDGKLRYSQAVKEHSSLAWVFVATKESREKGYLNIEMLKSRNQVNRPFTLSVDYEKMKVRDLQPEELTKIEGEQESQVDANKKGRTKKPSHPGSRAGTSSDYAPDLTE